MNTPFLAPILTPCTGVCCLDERGLCEGCYRTGDEIARWSQMGDGERLRLMEDVLPLREEAQG
ncbi:hypothetical protein N792_04225 [Lysobacter concretionis Ko07 = DSM 16239]|jgi:predicted Fe-S protein YdhL (DUF1289 family)|uniref:DUF1289 domain-containing protein n=1 Tax=Lysobacter concretionis Ko07 = DSM 16239 TaxID=1122185 RepID=A0A0A0ET70_9GAMM|nr:hypothetical protein N792_04225 [Lysobacter concretionis Ko07 = DSM 16239]